MQNSLSGSTKLNRCSQKMAYFMQASYTVNTKNCEIYSKQVVQRDGFSLIELLISSSIIMLLILGTSQALLYAIHIKSRVRSQIAATELAKTKLEYFKSLTFGSPELQPNSWAETISQPNTPLRYQLKGKIINESNSLKRIEIECYSTLHPQKSTRIALLISLQLGF